ncbi:glycoside hydrolase family 35 protein [Caballeronia insecticola]|nr:beta-galactosidase [Caballeronia insecticola]
MPSPDDWPDVLQRIRAAGFNSISILVPWNYHTPAEGMSRWDGRYDLERFLSNARDAGLYVVVRPGPYIQGEVDGGGYPSWALGKPGFFRTNDSRWQALWQNWYGQVMPRIARWQYGGANHGTVIAVQIENEYPGVFTGANQYMSALYTAARSYGITVPITHNDQQVFGSLPASGKFANIVDLYGFDNYPYGFQCCSQWNTKTFSQVDQFESMYRAVAPHTPLYSPEMQGGLVNLNGQDKSTADQKYDRMMGYATVQQLSTFGQGVTMVNQYLAYSGTTWGYSGFPSLGTAYDSASPIRQWTGLGTLFDEQRRINLMVDAASPALAATDQAGNAVTSNDSARLYRVRRSIVDGSLHVFLRNADAGDRAPTLKLNGHTTLPVPLPAYSARYLVAGLNTQGWMINWTTAELLHARPGTLVFMGDRGRQYEASVNNQSVTFTVGDPQVIRVAGGQLLILDRDAAARFWPLADKMVVGPALVTGNQMSVDKAMTVYTLASGNLVRTQVAGPDQVTLPVLSNWRFQADSPERLPSYDDSAWRNADIKVSQTQYRPVTSPILNADAYGMPTGYVWYRGRFSGAAKGMCIEGRHRYQVWLNGNNLGTFTSNAEAPGLNGLPALGALPMTHDARAITFPSQYLAANGNNVISVLTENWGHTMDALASNQAKQPRGLISAGIDFVGWGSLCGWTILGETPSVAGIGGLSMPPSEGIYGGITWKIQGGNPADYPNASGLTGERAGWYKPEYSDAGWTSVRLPDSSVPKGQVGWYRTTFSVTAPAGVRLPLGIQIPSAAQPGELFVNGVHIGRAGRDNAEVFPLTPGLVYTDGRPNVIAYARWVVGSSTSTPALSLVGFPGEKVMALP